MLLTQTQRPYQQLYESGELAHRLEILLGMLESCRICPRLCGNNRLKGEVSFCRSGRKAIVSSVTPHFGEEPPLAGTRGAGGIFFGNCNLKCVYCQNYQISQDPKGQREYEMSAGELADKMLFLQGLGCHNIDLVSPTHFVPQIVEALLLAIPKGLSVPLVYNTNAYDSVEVLKLLDGVIDIYLPDMKYGDDEAARRYSFIQGYVEHSRAALREMYRQVGDLELDEKGLAARGVMVRHLVLPNDLAGSEETLRFIDEEISKTITLSIMSQYYPANKAFEKDLLSRRIRAGEYLKVLDLLKELGFENGWTQEFDSEKVYRPDFKQDTPFDKRELGLR